MYNVQKTLETFHTRIKNGVDSTDIRRFKTIIKTYYKKHGRPFAWRSNTSPYSILVSEIMLQQTQTSRVIEKYKEWMKTFPSLKALAQAPLKNVLRVWQGMGYNRRAIALKSCAEIITNTYKGRLPKDPEILIELPHVGPNTAGSIAAFAFNSPTVFIETNIRSVFIAFFFPNKTDVHDNDILELVEKTLDKKNPREWYYALMDYGVLLKKTLPNPNKKSRHYTKQSTFVGSNRQIRGAILRVLNKKKVSIKEIMNALKKENIPNIKKSVVEKNMNTLQREGFITCTKGVYSIV